MDSPRGFGWGPVAVSGLGAVLFAVAAVHHLREPSTVGGLVGPLSALALDGSPALGLAYAGYWLRGRDLGAARERAVAVWSLAGAVLFAATLGVSMAIRLAEGRAVTEPTFTLLLSAGVGGLAGFLGGYYRVQSLVAAQRSEQTAKALAFVNGVIRHDLRNDLQVIRGNAQVLETDAETAEVVDGAATIREKATQANDRIETTQTLVNALTGSADREVVDLTAVVEDVAEQARALPGATVETDLPDAAPVLADQGLRSVVDNLVENAVEHNDRDDPEVAVTVTGDGDTVRLAVRDNGPGLTDDQRETLFEQPAEADPGGLQIVQTLARSYGGQVRVEAAQPRGSRFVVDLPAAEGRAEADAVA